MYRPPPTLLKVLAAAGAKLRRKTMMHGPMGRSFNVDPYM